MRRSTRINLLLMPVWLAVGAAAALLVLRVPMEDLTAEGLASARARWESAGVADYDMRFRMHGGEYAVRCRRGVVESLTLDGRPVTGGDPSSYSVPGLIDVLAMELEMFRGAGDGAKQGETVFLRVRFDGELGLVRRYLRSGAGFSGPQGRGAVIELLEFTPVTE